MERPRHLTHGTGLKVGLNLSLVSKPSIDPKGIHKTFGQGTFHIATLPLP